MATVIARDVLPDWSPNEPEFWEGTALEDPLDYDILLATELQHLVHGERDRRETDGNWI
jgi:hypothetical protein